MPQCSIKWCGKKSTTSNMKKDWITFHLYPQDGNIKGKWIDATKRDDWMPSKYSVICSSHFTEDCFIVMKNRRRLIKSAIPTLFLPLLISAVEDDGAGLTALPTTPRTTRKRNFPGTPSQYNSPSTKRLCRRVIELTDKVVYKNRQLKNLREKTRYLRKRIASLKTVLKELQNQNLITSNDSDLLSKIGATSRELIKRQILKSKNGITI